VGPANHTVKKRNRHCHLQLCIYHHLLHYIYITSSMFRLSYPAIIRELVIVDNKQLMGSHRMVNIHILQLLCYTCRFKIIKYLFYIVV
jgi:hypothetical protein